VSWQKSGYAEEMVGPIDGGVWFRTWGHLMIRVFIGFDARETVAFHVLSHSIHARASEPVSIASVSLSQLRDVFQRERNPLQSTEFSFSRFLVPYLCNYEGWSLFLDCDMLFLDDIANLWNLRDDRFAVLVAKHDYVPKDEIKFLGATQTKYQKKNWSSVMLFNNARCRALSPEYVNHASGLELHQFKWLDDEALVGDLPLRWNYLVGEYEYSPEVSAVHYTIGGPYFDDYKKCDYAREWFEEREAMLRLEQKPKT
jgi:lipopolysaccharide biosynthesis glycosyltransferase